MHSNRIVIAELVKHTVIPVLYVNDYIVPASNGYEALSKELCLFEIMMNKKQKPFWDSQHNDNNEYTIAIPQYLSEPYDMRQQQWQQRYDFLTIQDKEDIEQLPNAVNVCLGNIACGASMFGILLILTFCR